jgi:hypothetical protein
MKRWRIAAGLLLAIIWIGCTSYYPLQIASESRPGAVPRNGAQMVEGRSCQNFVLGLRVNSGNTARAALDQAKQAAGSEALTDVTMDSSRTSGLLWSQNCTIVHGVPARN